MAGKIVADTIEASGSQISLNVGNVTVLTASSTGLTLIPTTNVNINLTNSIVNLTSGNVTNPSLTFSGNTSTGIFMPAANTIAFTTAGTEDMRITSDGNIGIGESASIVRKLCITASGTTATTRAGIQLKNEVGTTAEIYQGPTSDNALIFDQNGSERMRIDTSGNLKFNSGYGSVATAYGCRAWVNFNGSGVVAIRGSGNVTSITDNGTGDYTVNFTTAMPDTNYVVTSLNRSPGVTSGSATQVDVYATGSTRMLTLNPSFAAYDSVQVHVAFFR